MHRMLRLFLLGCVLCGPAALADQITLKNGDRLTGTVVKSDDKGLVIKSEFAGTVTVQWAAVESISADQVLFLTLKDGQTVAGTVTTAAGKFEVETKETGRVTVAKDAIQLLRSKDEQAAHLAEVERFRDPGLLDLWSGTADAGLSLTRGNADTLTVALGANAARTTRRDKTSVYFASLLAKNNTAGPSLTTANAIRGGLRYDINLSSRTFAFGFSDLEFDEFQKLDLRLVLGGGFGWHVKKSERTLFDVFGGGSLNKEYFSTGLRRSSGEVLFGEELTHKLSGRVSFKERAVIFPNISEGGEYRLSFDASAVTQLSRWLGWQVTVSDRYVSNPLPGIKKNDLLLTTGLRVSFGAR